MTEPRPIRVLDSSSAALIAAGEVVERPASVVKELVENSVDAGAEHIRVEIRDGGRRLIAVSDDGHGIAPDQVELAFEHHATSKIGSGEDLESISTLGFRGEALTSIAAVGEITMLTREAGAQVGVRVRLADGRVVAREAAGCPVGTVVTVERLFQSVPARLKFLRTPATEAAHIQAVVTRYALAYPNRCFTLVRDKRTVFQSTGSGGRRDVLVAVFGADVAREMIEIASRTPIAGDETARERGPGEVEVTGFVSPPHIHRATRKHITLLCNGRWIQDRSLAYAISQAYHTLLPKGRFPLAVVLLSVPVDRVDVNVHPAKSEVRFRDERLVFSAVERTVRRAVVDGAPVAPMRLRDDRAAPRSVAHRTTTRFGTELRETRESPTQPALSEAGGAKLPMLRVLGQLALTYIVAEADDGLYIIDQHAAHERVMYEQLRASQETPASQPLLSPEPVSVPPRELAAFAGSPEALEAIGFDLEQFGPDTVLVRAIPQGLESTSVPELIAATLEELADGESLLETELEERLVRVVCKKATIKAGQALTIDEMRSLVRQLEATDSPHTCPHGRPTVTVLSRSDLDRGFRRH